MILIIINNNNNIIIIKTIIIILIILIKFIEIITTIAGTGVGGYNGESLNPNNLQIFNPTGIAIDSLTSKIYFSDKSNYRIRVLY
jgi:hypothetical protein